MSRKSILLLGTTLGALAGPAAADDGRLLSLKEAADDKPSIVFCEDKNPQRECDEECQARAQIHCARTEKAGPSWIASDRSKTLELSGALPYAEKSTWQSQVIGGVGEFLATRTKAEVISWLEDLVGKQLCALTYQKPELSKDGKAISLGVSHKWFAESCLILESEDYGARKATGVLAAMIRKDLDNLPVAALYTGVAGLAAHPTDPGTAALAGRALEDFQAVLAVIQRIRRGDASLEIVSGLGRSGELRHQCQLHSSSDKIAPECGPVIGGLIVEFFGSITSFGNVSTRSTEYFDDMFRRVFGSDKLCKDIVEVFDPAQAAPRPQRCNRDDIHVPRQIQDYLYIFTLASETYEKYRTRLERVARDMVLLEAKLESIRKTAPTVTNLTDADAAFQELVDAGASLFDREVVAFDSAMAISRDILKIAGELQTRDYVAAGQDIIHALTEIEDAFKMKFPPHLKQFLTFIVDMASAQTSDDVAAVIEGIAAPIGGWKLKQEHLALSVTGLVGGLGGYEWPVKREVPATVQGTPPSGYAAGVFAPVGLDLTWPLSKHHMSMGLFGSVLDIGQVTWARLSNTQDPANQVKAEVASTVDFSQVLSPGVYLHVSLGHSPITAGVGLSFAPALRKYTFGSGTGAMPEVDQLSTVRFGAFLAVDITILPIWVFPGAD